MFAPFNVFVELRDFLEQGGVVLWALFILSFILFYFAFYYLIKLKNLSAAQTKNLEENNEWAIYYNELDLTSQTKQMMKPIKTICALAPLMGLLGTLIGMIEIFDVIAISGTGNIRALASGIAAATLPTMAGMVISVVGLLFVILLERKTKEVVS